jgi:hypothetical protein
LRLQETASSADNTGSNSIARAGRARPRGAVVRVLALSPNDPVGVTTGPS